MTLFKLSAITLAVASLAACQSMSGSSQKAGSSQRAGGSQQAAPRAAAAPAMAPQATGLRTTTVEAAAGADYPPARVGECYARVVTPAAFNTTTEQVLVRAASSTITVVPATYAPGEERVLSRGETRRLEVIPATYEEVTERVMIKSAGSQLVTTPATYKTMTERRLVRAATTAWKRSSELSAAERALQNIDPNAGDVLCLVEVPAQYETVNTQVIDQAASTRSVEIPAEFTTVTKTVQKTPPTTREVLIPAEYRNVVTSKLVTPAREVRTEVPAEYTTKTNTVMTSAAKSEWRQIVCETNATPAKLAEIQTALTKAGFATGRTDGGIDATTMNAVRGYQKAKGLPVDMDRYINVATVRALGVSEK